MQCTFRNQRLRPPLFRCNIILLSRIRYVLQAFFPPRDPQVHADCVNIKDACPTGKFGRQGEPLFVRLSARLEQLDDINTLSCTRRLIE